MARYLHCQACTNEKYGIKTRIQVDHVCPKGDKKYKEPESKVITSEYCKSGTYFKIYATSEIANTGKSALYSIKRGQWVNGYKVGAGHRVWFPYFLHLNALDSKADPCIWVHEEIYNKMAFINT